MNNLENFTNKKNVFNKITENSTILPKSFHLKWKFREKTSPVRTETGVSQKIQYI